MIGFNIKRKLFNCRFLCDKTKYHNFYNVIVRLRNQAITLFLFGGSYREKQYHRTRIHFGQKRIHGWS